MLSQYLFDHGHDFQSLMWDLMDKVLHDVGGYTVDDGLCVPVNILPSAKNMRLYCLIIGWPAPDPCPAVLFILNEYFRALVNDDKAERERLGTMLVDIYTVSYSP